MWCFNKIVKQTVIFTQYLYQPSACQASLKCYVRVQAMLGWLICDLYLRNPKWKFFQVIISDFNFFFIKIDKLSEEFN